MFEKVLPTLRTRGRLVTAGAITGPVVTLDLRVVYLQRRPLIGSTMHTPAHFDKVLEAIREGSIQPVGAETCPLEIHRAQARFLEEGLREQVGAGALEPRRPAAVQ